MRLAGHPGVPRLPVYASRSPSVDFALAYSHPYPTLQRILTQGAPPAANGGFCIASRLHKRCQQLLSREQNVILRSAKGTKRH